MLKAHRHPVLAGEVANTFEDKYCLVEGVTRMGGLAALQGLDLLVEGNLGEAELRTLVEQTVDVDATAALVGRGQATCTFLREQERTEKSGTPGRMYMFAEKTTVREYVWNVEYTYEFSLKCGNGNGKDHTTVVRKRSAEVLTRTKQAPFATTEQRVLAALDLTWLLQQYSTVHTKGGMHFRINRDLDTCRTACRNKDVDEAKTFFADLAHFATTMRNEMKGVLAAQGATAHGSFDTNAEELVVAPVPLMVEVDGNGEGALLQTDELGLLVEEQARALRSRVAALGALEHAGSLGSGKEAGVLLVVQHLERMCDSYSRSVAYVEALLREQLTTAVGKEVSTADFAEYMGFHMRKHLQRAFVPRGLAVSVRHGNLNPEGSIIIQDTRFDNLPVPTFSRSLGSAVMRFDLNATTEATLQAQLHLHTFVDHQFGGGSGNIADHVHLRAEAQQFSAFVVLLGTVSGDDAFRPKHALIVQNRDVFDIPLLLETIPSKKEFAKAVEGLSPEQRAFAEAYRSMQMESTLFGMCVVQVKPHLERVLQLPEGSLTKEIQLTQDLLDLFLVYNIRSDLLSQDTQSKKKMEQSDRVAQVKHHVDVVKQMLSKAKEEEVSEAHRKKAFLSKEEDDEDEDEDTIKSMPVASKFSQLKASLFDEDDCVLECLSTCAVRGDPDTTTPTTPTQPHSPAPSTVGTALSVSTFPHILERSMQALGVDDVRPTIVKVGDGWKRTFQQGLLGTSDVTWLRKEGQTDARGKAFGLLDSLTRSGLLPLTADMHVVVASTHSFGETLMDTLVQENVNPIAAVQASSLVVASALHETEPDKLLTELDVRHL